MMLGVILCLQLHVGLVVPHAFTDHKTNKRKKPMKHYNVPPTTPFGEAHDKTRQIMVLIGHIQSIAFATEDADNIIHCLEMIRSSSYTSIVNIKHNIKSAPVSDAGVVCWFVIDNKVFC